MYLWFLFAFSSKNFSLHSSHTAIPDAELAFRALSFFFFLLFSILALNSSVESQSCKPKVSTRTKAVLTLNGFEKGKDGGGPSECDSKYHSDDTPIVALSTGWFNKMNRCFKNITIHGNGKSVNAMVVDECDSTMGCDNEHDYQPPCDNNIVDASRAVWEALGVKEKDRGEMDIHWSDS